MANISTNCKSEYIYISAIKLFFEKGYDATSYTEIARTSGMKKSLVQYYFPQKEIFLIKFFHWFFGKTIEYIQEYLPENSPKESIVFPLGQVFYSFLLKDKKAKLFTQDFLSHRDLTEQVITLDAEWLCNHLEIGKKSTRKEALENSLFSMGGFYEFVYHKLKNNEDFSLNDKLISSSLTFLLSLGYTHSEAMQLLHCCTLSSNQISLIVHKLELDIENMTIKT